MIRKLRPQRCIKVVGSRTRGYVCDGCGKMFHWDDDCKWFGSHKDLENEVWHKIWFACCQECAEKMPTGFSLKTAIDAKSTKV